MRNRRSIGVLVQQLNQQRQCINTKHLIQIICHNIESYHKVEINACMHALSHTQTFITTKRYQSRARFYNGIQRIIARNKVLYCASCARDSSIDGAEFVAMCCVPIRGTISKLLAGNAAGNAMAY
jgi:hypothetical protein